LAVIAVEPLVIDAGETLVISATAGSTNCRSRKNVIALARSARTTDSAAGLLNRTSSSVSTTIAAALAQRRVTVSNAMEVTGFGACSPTQLTDVPAVARGNEMLNGTRRNPGIRPMMVSGRRNSANSDDRFCATTSGAAHVGSNVVPGAIGAFIKYSTSCKR